MINAKYPKMPSRPGRAVPYIRVSALMGRGGDDFHSPELQLGHIGRAVTQAGMEIVLDPGTNGPITDIDRSGRDFNRAGIDRVRQLAELGSIDAIAVYDISRLGRNVLESLLFMQWLEVRGVVVISACEQIDTSTPAGKLMLHNMLSVAQYRSDETARNWTQLIAKRAASGKHHGNRLTGYTSVEGALTPNEFAPAMTEGFRRWAAGTKSMHVCQYLSAALGKPVSLTHLKRWLSNPAYRGFTVSDGIALPGLHTALMDEATWQKVERRLARDAGTPPRSRTPDWACCKIVFCHNGCSLARQPGRHHVTGQLIYRVSCRRMSYKMGGGTCAGIGTPLLEPIEKSVLEQASEYISRLRTDVNAAAAFVDRQASAQIDIATMKDRLSKTRTALKRIREGWALGDITDTEYQDSLKDLRAAEQAGLTQLEEAQGTAGGLGVTPVEAADAAGAMLEMWPRMTGHERNIAMRSIVKHAAVRPKRFRGEPEGDRVVVTAWMF
jgi:site-specific DNA recombinase